MKIKSRHTYLDDSGNLMSMEFPVPGDDFPSLKEKLKESAAEFAKRRNGEIYVMESDRHLYINYLNVNCKKIDSIYTTDLIH